MRGPCTSKAIVRVRGWVVAALTFRRQRIGFCFNHSFATSSPHLVASSSDVKLFCVVVAIQLFSHSSVCRPSDSKAKN